MRTTAAVMDEVGSPLVLQQLSLADPGPGEVRVRVAAAGVCHSDLHYLTGDLTTRLPVVPGHEGSGTVEEVGAGVVDIRPGDRVAFLWRPRCGHCVFCLTGRPVLCQGGAVQATTGGLLDGTRRWSRDGVPVHHLMGVSCFAEHCVVSERAVVRVPDEVPPEIAAITGCAVITGVGVVLNVLQGCAGLAVVIFGAGGVGLSAVMGAVLAGAGPIVVVDVVPERLQAAKDLGATHVVDATDQDPVEAVVELTGGGADWAIEAVGRPDTLARAFDTLRPGGTVVAVGLGAAGRTFEVPLNGLVQKERRIVGSLYGSSNPLLDVPRLLQLYLAGRLPLDRLVGHRYSLPQINDAFADLGGTAVGRGVLIMDGAV